MVMVRQSPLFSWVMYQQFLLSLTVSYHPFYNVVILSTYKRDEVKLQKLLSCCEHVKFKVSLHLQSDENGLYKWVH